MQNLPPVSKDVQIKRDCTRYSINCLGKSHIFTLRAKSLRFWITVVSVSGILVPLVVGGIAGTFGADNDVLIIALIVASPLGLIQLVLSALSLLLKWDDRLAYSMESSTANSNLSEEFQNLRQYAPTDVNDLETEFRILQEREKARDEQDKKYLFRAVEERIGLRYALYIKQIPCVSCQIVPTGREATEVDTCKTCGNF